MQSHPVRAAGRRRSAAAGRADRCRPRSRRPSAEAPVPDDDAAQRADGRAGGGSLDADRAPAALVSRRLEEREARPHRVRASVRAPDVQGLEERASPRRTRRSSRRSAARATPTRPRTTTVFWETVPSQYLPLVLWLEADRMATLRIDKDTFTNEREVVKEERRMRDRQPAVRPAERDHLRPGVHGPPLQAPDDRQHGGPRGGVDRRRARLLPHVLRAGERDAGARRRLRLGAGAAARRAVPRARAEGGPSGAARHPAGAAADAGEARHARRSRGRCRPWSSRTTSPTTAIPTRIRCTSRRRCCPTARARASTRSWCTRSRWRWRRSARRT